MTSPTTTPRKIELGPANFIHYSSSQFQDTFNILILCDGFIDSPEKETTFYNYCRKLRDRFFSISPFYALKKYIQICAWFTPSIKGIINEDKEDTAFGSYIENGNKAECDHPEKILALVNQIEWKIGNQTFTGGEVWLNKNSKSFGAIAIALNAPNNIRVGARFQYTEGGFLETIMDILGIETPQDKWRFFSFPLLRHPDPYFGLEKESIDVFVHELGHTVNGFTELSNGKMSNERTWLEDEYEEIAEIYEGDEMLSPNVTKIETVQFTSSGIENLKWKKLASKDELEKMRTRDPNTVILKNTPSIDRRDYPRVDPKQTKLVEGGFLYAKGIFRPNIDCKMRKHKGPAFCKVCKQHLNRTIGGQDQIRIGSILPQKIKDLVEEKKLMQKLVQSLHSHVDLEGNPHQYELDGHCGTSTARIAVMLIQLGIELRNLRFGIVHNHAFLQYQTILIDPTFYQLYKNFNHEMNHPYSFRDSIFDVPVEGFNDHSKGRKIGFSKGFIGDFEQLKKHFRSYWPLNMNPDDEVPAELFETFKLYKLETTVRSQFDIPGYKMNPETLQIEAPDLEPQDQILANVIALEFQRFWNYKNAVADVGPWEPAGEEKMRAMYGPIDLGE